MTRRGNLKGGSNPGRGQIASGRASAESATALDPLLVALVKYLARAAAERDYAEHHNRRTSTAPLSGETMDSP